MQIDPTDVGLDVMALKAKYGDGSLHPTFTSEMWMAGPNENPAFNGYWDWVAHTINNVPVQSSDNPGPRGHEKVIPIHQNLIQDIDLDLSTKVPEGMTQITSLDDMAVVCMNWHHKVTAELTHMVAIPDGAKVDYAMEDDPSNSAHIILTGDALIAFRLGLITALNILNNPPFQAIVEDDDAKPAEPENAGT